MKDSEKIKAAICSIINDMEMDINTKFEVLDYQYNQYACESVCDGISACETHIDEEDEF